jgi:hypothetical protein
MDHNDGHLSLILEFLIEPLFKLFETKSNSEVEDAIYKLNCYVYLQSSLLKFSFLQTQLQHIDLEIESILQFLTDKQVPYFLRLV